MRTLIYNITYYSHNKSIYIMFADCNFKCVGCIRKRFLRDHHLYRENCVEELEKLRLETLDSEEFIEIVKYAKRELDLRKAILGGGEPTFDPMFCDIIKALNLLDLKLVILTNGYLLSKVLNCIPKSSIVELSVKSIHPEKFSAYTGRNKRDLNIILENMDSAFQSGLELIIETIFIPGFNEAEDIELLAEYVAHNLSRDVPLIIDEYVPIPSAPYRRPLLNELIDAKKRAEKHLKKVVIRSSYTRRYLGEIHLLYPKLINSGKHEITSDPYV
jgi:molybdenum cofactor biosynthesis enzyme MoaA